MHHRELNNIKASPILVGSIDTNNDIGKIPQNYKNIIRGTNLMSNRKEKNERNTADSFWNIFSNCGSLKNVLFDNCSEETKLKSPRNNDSLHSYNFRQKSRKKHLPGSSRRSVLDGDTGIFVITNSKERKKIERRSNCTRTSSCSGTERKNNHTGNIVHYRYPNLDCPDVTSNNLIEIDSSEKKDMFCEKGLRALKRSTTDIGTISTGSQTRITVEKTFQNLMGSDYASDGKSLENNTYCLPPGHFQEKSFSPKPVQRFDNKASLIEPEDGENPDNSTSTIEESKSYQENFIESGICEEQIITAALHEAELEEEIQLEDIGRYHCVNQLITQVPSSLWTVANTAAVMADGTEEVPPKKSDGTRNPFFVNPFSNENTERVKMSIGNILPTTTIANLTTKKYTLPDKNVASQVLMYRQLLHTECKPGLRLSRAYQGTAAQKAVKHMPWWEQGVETSKKMVISYDNLVVRLWLNGAIMPYAEGGYAAEHQGTSRPKDNEETQGNGAEDLQNIVSSQTEEKKLDKEGKSETEMVDEEGVSGAENEETRSIKVLVETLINDQGLPPIPHDNWVDRLGFQQTDPVTDFRSGGVLSLAMLVHIVESCPSVHARFLPNGDVKMLPFGITCINITDMIAKFCMFSKSVDRMDALLSQKPFWRMFGDPNALLSLQELSMEILCNVVVELGRERNISILDGQEMKESLHGEHEGKVTVFDFSEILSRTEKRVRDDLLASGPKTVDELRSIADRLRLRYERDISRREEKVRHSNERKASLIDDVDGKSTVGNQDVDRKSAVVIEAVAVNNNSNSTLAPSTIAGNLKIVTGTILGTANNIFNKIKENDRESKQDMKSTNKEAIIEKNTSSAVEEADSSILPSEISSNIAANDSISKPAVIVGTIKTVTGSILGTANNILKKIKQHDNETKQAATSLSNKDTDSKQIEALTIEEVNFASPTSDKSSIISSEAVDENGSGTVEVVSNVPTKVNEAIIELSVECENSEDPSTFTIDDEIDIL